MKCIWSLAQFTDIDSMIELSNDQYGVEIDGVFTPDPIRFKKHLMLAITEQSFNPLSVQIIVAKVNQQIVAYSWVNRGNWMTYAPEEIAEVLFVHIDLKLSSRDRISIIKDMIMQWELWCKICRIPVLISSTIRADQRAFLRLHEKMGFHVRGSFAFKRIEGV